ncbi:MAG: COX15/CtaA family protein [Acidobacteria bacterium]|nr:COX15/CtaA family protein [Acidobacteriota bacterium]
MATQNSANIPRKGNSAILARHRFAIFTASVTFLLIIAGGIVTGREAGLSVPDWPLSYGQWMPPMQGNILYEHSHRMIAAFVGLLTLVLAVWTWRKEERRWVRRLGGIAFLVVVSQGILGGIGVLYFLPLPISMGHASLAQIFFCLMVTMALVTSPRWSAARTAASSEPVSREKDNGTPQLRHLAVAASGAILLQTVLGAALRHSGEGIVPHVMGAVLVFVAAFWTCFRVFYGYPQQWNMVRAALILMALLFLQFLLGTGSYMIRLVAQDAPQPTLPLVALTTAHVAAGALTLAISVLLTLETHRALETPTMALGNSKQPGKVPSKVIVAEATLSK